MSVHLDIGGLDDGGPLCELVGQHLFEFGRRADLDLGAKLVEQRARFCVGEALAERGVELVDDGGRRAGPRPPAAARWGPPGWGTRHPPRPPTPRTRAAPRTPPCP